MRHVIIAVLVTSISSLQSASAVSLNGRTNDDSVCDLSPYTTSRLGQITFVPARIPNSEEIYTRLAMRFIVAACRTGQTLIMHSDDGSMFEDRYFSDIATKLCGASNIVREPYPTVEQPNAFRVRCQIVQLKSAVAWLHDAENRQSTEAMIRRGAAVQDSNDQRASDKQAADRQARCKKGLTYGALTGISGGCRD